MEELLLDIIERLRTDPGLGDREINKIIHAHNRGLEPGRKPLSKRRLIPYYLRAREAGDGRWESWNVGGELEKRLLNVLQVKPGRTASGVATISVITKPWPCSGACLFCPNDLRMPKSYLYDEPACQRAERNRFDPYLQVTSRLRALKHMGHPTDKVELIVLGGTWTDYPRAYRLWFAKELFAALNDGCIDSDAPKPVARRQAYWQAGIDNRPEALAAGVEELQERVDSGELGYNEAAGELYGAGSPWEQVASWQAATPEELVAEQRRNETAAHRCVGFVVETRPDAVDAASLREMRELGCTKVQVGVQSIDQHVLDASERGIEVARIAGALDLMRLFGFKLHTHFMMNLVGATPEGDKADYRRFATETAFQPDEVKLYPCSLTAGTGLAGLFRSGAWRPYTEGELVDVLASDMEATPAFTRVSRMIRDIPATDIVAGNRKTNLRQLVDLELERRGADVAEMRWREIRGGEVDLASLSLDVVPYETVSTSERFLQWVDPHGRLAGFCRLSLPRPEAVRALGEALPVEPGEAMVRELHVYGRVASIAGDSDNEPQAQHAGLGRRLLEHAEQLAREAGYHRLNVISAVGTREYYRALGFEDRGLYQSKPLQS
ncbi:MAG: elongator complex protein 3 [Coriobacteriales bacterium]|jgi:elongator complex protein 3